MHTLHTTTVAQYIFTLHLLGKLSDTFDGILFTFYSSLFRPPMASVLGERQRGDDDDDGEAMV